MADRITTHDEADMGIDIEGLDDLMANPRFDAAVEDAELRHRLLIDLVAQRKAMCMSQTAVAKEMQTTQSAISQLESGATDPHFSTLQRYARAVAARIRVAIELPAECPWQPRDAWASPSGRYLQGSPQVVHRGQGYRPAPTASSGWADSVYSHGAATGDMTLTA